MRRHRLQVAEQAKQFVAESCERWAPVLYRIAKVQWIVHGLQDYFRSD